METLVQLLAGNARHAAAVGDGFTDLQEGQHPDAVTVCCSDSRVLQNAMWDNEAPGRLFTCGNIGNRVVQRTQAGDTVSGDVLYPLVHTGTETAIVVGHTGCGAVTATYEAITNGVDEPAGIQHCIDLLAPHLDPGVAQLPDDLDHEAAVNHLVEYNVDRQVEMLTTSTDVPDSVTIAGMVYDFQDIYGGQRGEVHVVNLNGETDPETIRTEHPAVADRVTRVWRY